MNIFERLLDNSIIPFVAHITGLEDKMLSIRLI